MKAESLYKLLIEQGCIPEHVASTSLISFYGKQRKPKQAREVFEMAADSPANAKLLCNSTIDAHVKGGQLEAAYLFYKEVSKGGHDLGAVAISKIVNALINGGKSCDLKSISVCAVSEIIGAWLYKLPFLGEKNSWI